MLKNPKECFCLKQKQTFFVLNELTPPTCEDGSEPLMFHHERFSRFNFVIINADKKVTTANVPVSVLPGLFQKIDNLYLVSQMKELNKKTSDNNKKTETAEDYSSSPAYTVVIASGTLRGKTPVSALLEDANNKQMLLNQINWLKQNEARYPKNRQQINAIEQAIKLYSEGKLTASAAPNAPAPVSSVTVYSTGMRPLTRRKDSAGNSFVYEISIMWAENTPKPVGIEIKNYYAPVIQQENGLLNVMASKKINEVKNTFYLTIDEWLWMKRSLTRQLDTFENINAAKMYKIATENEIANKNAAMMATSNN